jgi:hypothetical protein
VSAVIVRPVPGPSRPYQFPAFERVALPNGLELIIAPVKRLPLVTIRFVLDVGARQEARDVAGVASLTAAALAEGTERLDAAALAEEFERLGGSLSSYATWDATHVRTTVLSSRLESALSLLSEVVRQPAFAPREVERLKEERLAELLEQDEPRGLADDSLPVQAFFAAQHPGGGSRTVQLTVSDCRSGMPRSSPIGDSVSLPMDADCPQAHDRRPDWWRAPNRRREDDSEREYASVRLLDRPGAPQSEPSTSGCAANIPTTSTSS